MNAAVPTTAFLTRLARLQGLRPDSWYLIAAATSTALGHGHTWVPAIYHHAKSTATTSNASVASANSQAAAGEPVPTLTPSQRVVRRLKEALFKSAILVGVPRVIEAQFALRATTENTPDFDTSSTRCGMDTSAEENKKRGLKGLGRVYREQYGPISSKMGAGMQEIQWMSENITYGLFLSPVSEDSPLHPLSFPETEMVVLSCLLAHRAKREVLWHSRGCLRSGLSAEEVEALQSAIEQVGAECGVDLKSDMPRVAEVTEEDDLTGL